MQLYFKAFVAIYVSSIDSTNLDKSTLNSVEPINLNLL